jgi:apolipoprotein N-acyltransferase
VRATVRDGANLLVNISNDSWMDAGDGAAPRQHFAMAVLRAVEMRRTLVRASAGGVSGFVAPSGEVHDVVPWGESGASIAGVVLQDRLTPYARFGEAWMLLSGAALLLGLRAHPEQAA